MIRRVVVAAVAGASIAGTLLAVGSAAAAGAAPDRPAASAATTKLVFNASFTGTRLNTRQWDTCFPWTPDPSKGCTLYGNSEYQWYLKSQVREYGGALHLVATPKSTNGLTKAGLAQKYQCRSGMITSYPGFRFKYGKVSVVARLTNKAGLWSAVWLAPASLTWPPEIDLFEHWGTPMSLTGDYFHAIGHALRNRLKTANLAVGWHTFTVTWTSSRLTWYLDGRKTWTVDRYIPHQQMYIVANLAEYEPVTAHSGRCDGSVQIKSVRVWQKR
jgi:beta-glucanase (GH16 family)